MVFETSARPWILSLISILIKAYVELKVGDKSIAYLKNLLLSQTLGSQGATNHTN
jgi:hypothetical protein